MVDSAACGQQPPERGRNPTETSLLVDVANLDAAKVIWKQSKGNMMDENKLKSLVIQAGDALFSLELQIQKSKCLKY
jgi:hypothetical protein